VPDILVVSDDVVGDKMAGPGIRVWELSRQLSRSFSVVLAIPDYSPPRSAREQETGAFRIVRYGLSPSSAMRDIAGKSRVIIIQGYILSKMPFLKSLPAHLVCDLYVPFPLENLFVHRLLTPHLRDRMRIHVHDLEVFNEQLLCGDHFLCANDRQRSLLLGALLALDRIDPQTADATPSLDGLISVVPFGFSQEIEEAAAGTALRGVVPGVGNEDVLFLWGGVLSNWFDPLTLLRGIERAVRKDPRIKLVFLSTGHPNPLLPPFEMAGKARRLSEELGLTGRHVFFHEDWVEYRRRGAFFGEADVGVYAHGDHVETAFAFRTRVLDYLKHGLPILATEGDSFAELIRNKRLGLVVPCGDAEAMADACLRLSENASLRQDCRRNIFEVRPSFAWEATVAPLVAYCRRVLEGRMAKASKPSRSDLATVAGLKKPGFLERTAKNRLRGLAQKLPRGIVARLRSIMRKAG